MSGTATALTTLKISAGIPATFDSDGYGGLSYTDVGEVTNIGDFGAEWQIQSRKPIKITGTPKVKTSRDPGGISIGLDLDTDDAGQILMKEAHASTALYAFLITTPEGDKYYCQALVSQFKVNLGGQDDLKTASAQIEVSTSATDVDWVEVLAA